MIGDVEIAAKVDQDFDLTDARNIQVQVERRIRAAHVGLMQDLVVARDHDVYVAQGCDGLVDPHHGLEAAVFTVEAIFQQRAGMNPEPAGVFLVAQPQHAAIPRPVAAVGPDLVEEGRVFHLPRFELRQVADFPQAEVERDDLLARHHDLRAAQQAGLELPVGPLGSLDLEKVAARCCHFADRLARVGIPPRRRCRRFFPA